MDRGNRRERIRCGCGGELTRPIPKICPHCGAEIRGIRRPLGSRIYPLLIILLMFAALVAYALWLVRVGPLN